MSEFEPVGGSLKFTHDSPISVSEFHPALSTPESVARTLEYLEQQPPYAATALHAMANNDEGSCKLEITVGAKYQEGEITTDVSRTIIAASGRCGTAHTVSRSYSGPGYAQYGRGIEALVEDFLSGHGNVDVADENTATYYEYVAGAVYTEAEDEDAVRSGQLIPSQGCTTEPRPTAELDRSVEEEKQLAEAGKLFDGCGEQAPCSDLDEEEIAGHNSHSRPSTIGW